MDSEITLLIPHKITINTNQLESENDKEKSLLDLLKELTASIGNKYKCGIDYLYQMPESNSKNELCPIPVTFVLSGKSPSVIKAKTELLKKNISNVCPYSFINF